MVAVGQQHFPDDESGSIQEFDRDIISGIRTCLMARSVGQMLVLGLTLRIIQQRMTAHGHGYDGDLAAVVGGGGNLNAA